MVFISSCEQLYFLIICINRKMYTKCTLIQKYNIPPWGFISGYCKRFINIVKRKKLAHHGRAYINMNAVQRMSEIVNFDTL